MKTLHPFTLALAIALLFITNTVKAQWVSIPDTNFATYLNNNGFSACLQGNNATGWQMDTTCWEVVMPSDIYCQLKGIADLTGIQYFDSLYTLNCFGNRLLALPPLPATLQYLDCSDQFYGVPFATAGITALPDLPVGLTYLNCYRCPLTALPVLPDSLLQLDCSLNQLTALPALPAGLLELNFSFNQVTTFPALPTGLLKLDCGDNLFSGGLPALPPTLESLSCVRLNLTSLPPLPSTLRSLNFGENNLSVMPTLPPQLQELACANNPIPNVGVLPASLRVLECIGLPIDSLPQLPDSLHTLDCKTSTIASLPPLPKTLTKLWLFGSGYLTALPELPDSMRVLDIRYTAALTCLPELKYIEDFKFANSGFTCWPNSPSGVLSSDLPLNTFPVCNQFNANGCAVYWNITGKAYNDLNADCTHNTVENGFMNTKMELWENGTRLKQAIPSKGVYTFDTDHYGTYQITIDTANIPFRILCPSTGSLNSVISAADSMDYSMDFALACKPGYDLEARSIASSNVFRPANFTTVEVAAGDATNFYGANCAAGTSGSVTLAFTGPVTFIAPAQGALTPTLSGNTLTYTIADFGTVNFFEDFDVVMQTDTFAQIGQQVCFTLTVNPIAGDNNPANNVLTICFPVVNSFDPNDKQAYPAGNIDTLQEELTYTVRFQNTGNAEAQHIYITDTLDANVRPETFELLAYSHQPMVQIDGNAVKFNFPNINLPDSFSNEPGSHGYVQYKVKLKENLPVDTVINNTAFIYFDFNAPVVTNTTLNTIYVPVPPVLKPVSISKYRIDRAVKPNGKL